MSPTSTRLVTLLDRLNRYTFDLKYLEGSKLKVSDALSRLYSEEKHKISDVIPLISYYTSLIISSTKSLTIWPTNYTHINELN